MVTFSMGSTAPSNHPAGDTNSTGGSYYQKTICLNDWWLIKVDKNGRGESIAVAGFPSREKDALRLFSSAPIAKLYSMCALETMDGIYVILNGIINKSRTLENGFSSEVFKHFMIGFPPYWEHFAEGYFSGSAANVVSREDEGRSNNLSKESPENSSKASGESVHIDSENLNTGAEDCVDMIPEPNFNTDSGLNSREVTNSKNLVDDVSVDGTAAESSIFNNEKDTSPVVEYPPSVSYDKEISLDVDGSSLPSAGTIINNPENSLIVENSRTCVDDSITHHQVLSELERNENRSDTPSRSSAKNDCFGTEKEDPKNKSLNKPVDFVVGRDIDEAAVYSDDRTFTQQLRKSKRKQSPPKASGVNDYAGKKLNKSSANQDSASNLDSKSKRRKGGLSKKETKDGRSTSKPDVSDRKNCSNNAAKRKESAVKDLSASGKKTKRKLNYGTPIKQGVEEGVSVVPIESMSCKRSRSGRLLLPSLEFWRNQTAVYDADRQITGIKVVPSTVKTSRGSKSEPPKKKSKRLV